jgi:hypothetical protein
MIPANLQGKAAYDVFFEARRAMRVPGGERQYRSSQVKSDFVVTNAWQAALGPSYRPSYWSTEVSKNPQKPAA